MRIGINALYLLPGKVGGSETYIRSLVRGLLKIDRDNAYFIFINKESVGIFQGIVPHLHIVPCPVQATNRPLRILWEQFILPLQVRRHRIDVLLSAGETAPFFCPNKSILVIYDLFHVYHPEEFSRFHLFFLRTIKYWSARTADGIITISEKSKRDIIQYFKMQPENITVAHLAVSHEDFHPADSGDLISVRTKYDLPERYILYAAALLPHKNHERLLQAFKKIKDLAPGRKLVFTGAWEAGHDTVSTMISALGLQQDVIMLGWLPFEDIPLVYRDAEMFIYPSLHEGFGLPVLEAMASGVPVICSRIEPLTEVAGDAALFVDPYDSSDIAQGMSTVLKDTALRTKLIEKGLRRAKEFTWEATALTTLAFLSSRKE
jgi:glycosyltransferase involved in cell wall biosynthesis